MTVFQHICLMVVESSVVKLTSGSYPLIYVRTDIPRTAVWNTKAVQIDVFTWPYISWEVQISPQGIGVCGFYLNGIFVVFFQLSQR